MKEVPPAHDVRMICVSTKEVVMLFFILRSPLSSMHAVLQLSLDADIIAVGARRNRKGKPFGSCLIRYKLTSLNSSVITPNRLVKPVRDKYFFLMTNHIIAYLSVRRTCSAEFLTFSSARIFLHFLAPVLFEFAAERHRSHATKVP